MKHFLRPKMLNLSLHAAVLVIGLQAAALSAQVNKLDDLQRCRSIAADDQRLACYDRLSADLAEATTVGDAETLASKNQIKHDQRPASITAQDRSDSSKLLEQLRADQGRLEQERMALEQEKIALEQQRAQLAQAKSEVEAQIDAQAKTQTNAVTAAAQPQQTLTEEQKLDAFGAEQISRSLRNADSESNENEKLEVIKARVVTVRGDRRRGYILVLDNGQVWSQRGSRYIDFLSDEKLEVEIERNSMNGYRLNQPATNRRIFVERIR
ncbi:MAG: hypothetical protein PF630_01715 [Gammaproteobacteria bacterium]|nr:hypothetical protein [Gammaproteobacteria bacterium]